MCKIRCSLYVSLWAEFRFNSFETYTYFRKVSLEFPCVHPLLLPGER